MKTREIAVIGSGISGLSAAWLLAKRHRVTLYESELRPGGHSNTVDCEIDGQHVAVDTGFIVYNPWAYPNLTALFSHLRVPTAPSEMSFSVSMGGGSYEYAGTNLLQLIGNTFNILSARHWRMIKDIPRFFRSAQRRAADVPETVTLGAFLADEGYSDDFMDRHLLPMAGAIWSAAPGDMRGYPARAFLRFFDNHGLLKASNRPQWRTVQGGAREYVMRLLADSVMEVKLDTPVAAVRRTPSGVLVRSRAGTECRYDDVVMATHADQALAILADPSADERRLLAAFRYSRNRAILHRDPALMPRRRRLWSSWNFLSDLPPGGDQASAVTYWMNRLQPLPVPTPLFVSLNPLSEPRLSSIIAEFDYAHPIFDPAAMRAQREIWNLQGRHNTWFCGAHFGAGFHEDGLQAGLAVAEQLGSVRRPWTVENESGRIGLLPPLPPRDRLAEAAE